MPKSRLLFLSVLLVATLLRLLNLPARYEVRDTDEPLYLYGSLNVLEGITPGMKAAPAGPQTWLGWIYASVATARNTILPDAQVRQLPLPVRPFFALQKTLFNLYHDTSSLRYFELGGFILAGIWSAAAAFRFGAHRGGPAVGLLAGLLVAALPMFVEFTGMARPYSFAWSFALIAVCYAGLPGDTRRAKYAAILLGLAVASRIEMIIVLPALWWLFWDRGARGRLLFRQAAVSTGVTLVTTLLLAPWFLTNIIGNLRTIATVRFAPNGLVQGHTTPSIPAFLWEQGLALALIIFLAGILLVPAGRRAKHVVLALFTLALIAAMFKEDGFGIRHNGPTVVVFLLALIIAAASLHGRWPRVIPLLALLVVALPLVQALRLIIKNRGDSFDENIPMVWIDAHIKPGSHLYLIGDYVRLPLPTEASGDALWQKVTGPDAWRLKFQAGLKRYLIQGVAVPRALSEENLLQERAQMRPWFILAGDPEIGPRFDIHAGNSPVFGLHDGPAEFTATGGCFVINAFIPLDTPHMEWKSKSGNVIWYVYYTPDALITP